MIDVDVQDGTTSSRTERRRGGPNDVESDRTTPVFFTRRVERQVCDGRSRAGWVDDLSTPVGREGLATPIGCVVA